MCERCVLCRLYPAMPRAALCAFLYDVEIICIVNGKCVTYVFIVI